MNISQIAMIRQPRAVVWSAMRDRLSELATQLSDIESVVTESRNVDDSGLIAIKNTWTAGPNLPALVEKHVNSGLITWHEFSHWYPNKFETQWQIEIPSLANQFECVGTTQYHEAMGKQGTRIAFRVEACFLPNSNGNTDGASPFARALESMIVTLVSKNFRKLVELADEMIQHEVGQTARL